MTNAAEAGRFRIGGAFDVNRLGFGAMRIVGRGIWGPPADRAEADPRHRPGRASRGERRRGGDQAYG